MRRAARTDSNQAEIVAALKGVGVSVEYIKEPTDLLIYVPSRKETALMEVKTDEGRLTKAQVEFIARWPGPIYIVRSAREAIESALGKEVLA